MIKYKEKSGIKRYKGGGGRRTRPHPGKLPRSEKALKASLSREGNTSATEADAQQATELNGEVSQGYNKGVVTLHQWFRKPLKPSRGVLQGGSESLFA